MLRFVDVNVFLWLLIFDLSIKVKVKWKNLIFTYVSKDKIIKYIWQTFVRTKEIFNYKKCKFNEENINCL